MQDTAKRLLADTYYTSKAPLGPAVFNPLLQKLLKSHIINLRISSLSLCANHELSYFLTVSPADVPPLTSMLGHFINASIRSPRTVEYFIIFKVWRGSRSLF